MPSTPPPLHLSCAAPTLLAAPLCLLIFSGCGSVSVPSATLAAAAGDWQFSSSVPAAAGLPQLGGILKVHGNAVTGNFSPMVPVGGSAQGLCTATSSVIAMAGSIAPNRQLTLVSSGFSGGTLTVSGTLADDNRSLTGATYNVSKGSCAFASAVPAIAQAFTVPNGTYSGTFPGDATTGGPFTVTAQITGTSRGDSTSSESGSLYYLGQNVCIAHTDEEGADFEYTGDEFYVTTIANDVSLRGNFNTDGTVLNVNSFNFIKGPCSGDGGSITLTKQ